MRAALGSLPDLGFALAVLMRAALGPLPDLGFALAVLMRAALGSLPDLGFALAVLMRAALGPLPDLGFALTALQDAAALTLATATPHTVFDAVLECVLETGASNGATLADGTGTIDAHSV